MDYHDLTFASCDGRLRLYARDYGAPQGPRATQASVLCLHGLTRNSADFHDLALHLKDRFRVLAPDMRGRGRSEWDDQTAHYQPAVYVEDVIGLLNQLALSRVIVIGASMGGLMAMIMAVTHRQRLQAAVINDVGPRIEPAGLARIASYAGKTGPATNWAEAAERTRLSNAAAFPDYGPDDWMAFARRLYVANADGAPVLAYDPAIAKGLEADSDAPVAPPDLWPLWDAMSGLPVLAIRGGLSDILSPATFDEMAARHPGLERATARNRGHAPMLDEPDVLPAIDAFLDGLRA